MNNVVDEICELFATKGHAAYIGEPVSQLEHALQPPVTPSKRAPATRWSWRRCCTTSATWCTKLPEDCADHGIDTRHEALGQAWLRALLWPGGDRAGAAARAGQALLVRQPTRAIGRSFRRPRCRA